MHLQCGTLQKKQVLTCLASRQKSGFWQPIHLGLSLLHTVLKPRGFLCCCFFFFFVVVVVSAGLLSALCLPGSTFTKLPTPCLQGRAICYFYLVSAVCYNSRPPQGELLFKQHSHIIMIFFYFFYFFGTVHIPYEYPTIHMSSSGLGWNISAVIGWGMGNALDVPVC